MIKYNYKIILSAFFLFIGGILIGSFIKNIPYFQWDTNIQVDEVANALLALILAIFLPFWINKWLENNKSIKQFLINEVAVFLQEVENIKNTIDKKYKAGSFNQEDKNEINLLFDHLDRRLDSLTTQISTNFPEQSTADISAIKESNTVYWKAITAGELMEPDFVINKTFWKHSLDSYFSFESQIKMFAHKINKY